ncbi:MAG: DUF2085 domain-containing protein [Ignavibacteriae bacterium]|nr:DUF2085 domain-containing protein [Ignavibacteriota bacterium]
MKASFPYIVLVCLAFIWCIAPVLPPMLAWHVSPANPLSSQLYTWFSHICHQVDSRSLHLFGMKLSVCARCSGIYVGFFLGVVLSPFLSRRVSLSAIKWWALALLPMLIDIALDVLGIHSSTIVTRVATGVVFGVNAAFILTPLIEESLEKFIPMNWGQRKQGVFYESQTR